jgi:hypothetical protein
MKEKKLIREALWIEHSSPVIEKGAIYIPPINMYGFPEKAAQESEQLDAAGQPVCAEYYFMVQGLWLIQYEYSAFKEWFRVAFCLDAFLSLPEVDATRDEDNPDFVYCDVLKDDEVVSIKRPLSEYLNANTQLLFSIIREKKYLCYDHYLRQELYP